MPLSLFLSFCLSRLLLPADALKFADIYLAPQTFGFVTGLRSGSAWPLDMGHFGGYNKEAASFIPTATTTSTATAAATADGQVQ